MSISKIGEFFNVYRGKTPISNAVPGDYQLVTTSENKSTSHKFDFDCNAVCIPLVSSTGHGHASINRLHYVEGKFALGTILAALTSINEEIVRTKFLYIYLYLLKDDILVPLMKGSANVSLTINAIKSIDIEVPSIEVQENIIKKFELLESYHDRLKNSFNNQLQSFKRFQEAIFVSAFQGKLVPQNQSDGSGKDILDSIKNAESTRKRKREVEMIEISEIPYKIPKSWIWLRLGQIAFDLGQKKPHNDFIYVDVSSIDNEKGEIVAPRLISGFDAPSRARKVASKGSIIYSTVRPNLNNVAIVKTSYSHDLIVSTAFIVINELKNLNSRYLFYYLKSDVFRSYVENKMSGVSYPAISDYNFYNGIIPIPPYKEQNRIVDKIDEFNLLHDSLKVSYFKMISDAEDLFTSILDDLFIRHLETASNKIVSPFSFPKTEEKKKRMKPKSHNVKKGNWTDVDISILSTEFKNQLFTFSQIDEKSKLTYEELKSRIFDLLEVSRSKVKPYLQLSFDSKKEVVCFQIVDK